MTTRPHDISPDTTHGEFWDTFYSAEDRVWSGRPNAALVREVTGLTPGHALDLGCGEGADAIWLARQGWRVTAVDVSQVALDRGAGHAASEGVADGIEWQRHDLSVSFPTGTFDLVSTHFLHSWLELPRERILRGAADAVAPGGVLLITGHAGFPSWVTDPDPDIHFPTPEEVLAGLDLADGQWDVLVSAVHEEKMTDPEGKPATRTDNTVKVRRR
ncbi:class I SAM-dependent methyltransferase [Streptomyces sp. PRKS01-29]|nr:class I SAM-dependent methyltransferase [Streptomyces sabulosicollis]MBI0294909.1 class I SAM-dependent methyltransferase [Streptomyces sabulosicollis]